MFQQRLLPSPEQILMEGADLNRNLCLYSFKKFSIIPQESMTLENVNILFQCLAA